MQYYASTFAKDAILIFDDANFEGVIDGANDGLIKSNLEIKYTNIIFTDPIENKEELWNGLYIVNIK